MVSGARWQTDSKKSDFILPGETESADSASFKPVIVGETAVAPEHLDTVPEYSLDTERIRHLNRIYMIVP